ncbi:glucose transporter [Kwoniella heveanensis CBS 569]|nr:glucose transporter [Kwoniella heveanensis CBS 569]
MPLSPRLYTFLCGSVAAFGAALFGYDLGVISYVTVAPNFLSVTGLEEPTTQNENYLGFIVSSMLLGAFAGSVPAGLIADKFSRRFSIVVGGLVFIVGGILQTAAASKGMMMAGRFFAGWGIGSLGVLVPLYQSEIAHPSQRGRMIATFQFSLGLGAFIAGWVAYGCAQGSPGTALQWRLPLAFQMFPAIPLVSLIYLLPESPRWLMIKGRQEESLRALARLHASGNIEDPFVQGEFMEMRSKVTEEASMQASWSDIFRNRTNARKVLLGVILQFSVQMTGVSAIQYYSPRVYSAVGFKGNTPLLIQSINNINGLAGELLCILFLDKVGRRIPLIGGNIISGICFAVCTGLAKQFATGTTSSRGLGILFVAMTFIYNNIFSSCIGPLSWVYPVEIMNTGIRAKAASLTTMASWLANFMIGQVSPIAFAKIGWRYYLVFTVCSFTNALTFYLFFPETKGRTLEEMDSYFRDNHWIVPLARVQGVSVSEREQQLAHGQTTAVLPHESKEEPVVYEEKA